jgi:transposase
MTDDLNAERNRLCNRLHEQFWRYVPAMLELEPDLGAEWFLDLWELVPTPDKAMRIRQTSIARILKSRRIRPLAAPKY